MIYMYGFIYHVQQHKTAGCKQLAGGSVPQAAPHNCKYPGELLVPPVTYKDFEKALRRAHSSVATDELERFVNWTSEFGQDG